MFLVFASVDNVNPVFSIFENNLINWLVLLGFVFWLWQKYMPGVFAARQEKIETALAEAAQARAEGEAFLLAQKDKVASAQIEADKILTEAAQVAREMRQQMEAQTQKEMADLRERMEQDIANERQLAISQLRSVAAKAAIVMTEAALPNAITDSARGRLLDQFIEQLEVARKQA